MEDIFRKKLEDFEAPHGDRWENISAALPPQNKKRRAFWLWFGSGSALLLLTISLFIWIDPAQPRNNVSERRIEKINPSGQGIRNVAPNASSSPEMMDAPSALPEDNPSNVETQERLTTPPAVSATLAAQTDNNNTLFSKDDIREEKITEDMHPFAETGMQEAAQDSSTNPEIQDEPLTKLPVESNSHQAMTSPKQPNKLSSNKESTGKWSLGFGMGVYASRFNQRMPAQQGNSDIELQGMVQRNMDLRRKMEKTGIAFSQSLWIRYQPFSHWSFSTGISMVQTTQKLAFNLKSQVPDSVRGPQDFPEIGTTGPGSDYLFENDSIQPGSKYSATNKYFSREIPLFVHYHLPISEKMDIQVSLGGTYRWITGASIFFADIDNVGMIYLNGAAYYPGLRSTWNLQGGIALNYHLNDHFDLNVMPGFQFALQSNIRHKHYVQQYQRQWGLQVRLTRKLGF